MYCIVQYVHSSQFSFFFLADISSVSVGCGHGILSVK